VTEEIIHAWSARDSSLSAGTEDLVAQFNGEAESYDSTVSQMMRNFLEFVTLSPILQNGSA